MAIPAGWVKRPDGKSYSTNTFTVNNVQYELVVNGETGNSDLYQKSITGNQKIASTDSGNNWKLTDKNKFLETIPTGTTTSAKAEEYFANNFTLKLNQNRANVINGVNANTSSFTNTPGVNNVTQAGTGTNPVALPPGSNGSGIPGITDFIDAIKTIVDDPLSGAEELAKGFAGNEAELFRNFLLKYPNDLLDTKQDTLSITQFTYKAPQESIFKTNSFDAIIKEGLARGTDYKESPKGTVILPMPNGVRDSNNVDWASDSMNALNAAVASEIRGNLSGYGGAFLGGQALSAVGAPISGNTAVSAAIITKLIQNFASSQNLKTSVGSGLVSTISTAAGYEISAESILSRGFGIVPNSNIELLFSGPMLRDFGFAYRMSPRNETEARAVRNIIRFFKQGMAARKNTAGNNFFLSTPNIFKLKYTYNGKNEIKGVNKIKTCALTSFNVDYSPDGQWASYEEGQPASVLIAMSFKELEPIYSTDYSSSNKVPDDSVGF